MVNGHLVRNQTGNNIIHQKIGGMDALKIYQVPFVFIRSTDLSIVCEIEEP